MNDQKSTPETAPVVQPTEQKDAGAVPAELDRTKGTWSNPNGYRPFSSTEGKNPEGEQETRESE